MFISVETTSLETAGAGMGYRDFLAGLVSALQQTGHPVEVVSPSLAQATSLGMLFDRLTSWTDYIVDVLSHGSLVVADGWLLTAHLCLLGWGKRWSELFCRASACLVQPDVYVLYDQPSYCSISRRWLLDFAFRMDVPLVIHTPDQGIADAVQFVLRYSHDDQEGGTICHSIGQSGMRLPPSVSA